MFRGHFKIFTNIAWSLVFCVTLSGCTSISEGVTRALMSPSDKEDTRQCYIRGQEFDGIEQLLEDSGPSALDSEQEVKILMVHGIGTHLPDYSTRLAENLARELGLSVVDRQPKNITLRLPSMEDFPESSKILKNYRGNSGDKNGFLRVDRYRSKSDQRSMIFYELTWSEVTEADKKLLAYDDSGEYSFRRAELNNELKQFINSHLPDPLMYLGNAQTNIQFAVNHSLCWMFARDYDDIPVYADEPCQLIEASTAEFKQDKFVFISHSLGSRIMTDAIQQVADIQQIIGLDIGTNLTEQWNQAFRDTEFTIFMLSNQLPLLQLGQSPPTITNQYAEYCSANGSKQNERAFKETNVVAFSDPNDILSWAVPPDYQDNHIDSRMCTNLVNVIINIADVKNVLGLEFAPPGLAHRGYDDDERVIKIMARGMSDEKADPLVKDRCQWLEVR